MGINGSAASRTLLSVVERVVRGFFHNGRVGRYSCLKPREQEWTVKYSPRRWACAVTDTSRWVNDHASKTVEYGRDDEDEPIWDQGRGTFRGTISTGTPGVQRCTKRCKDAQQMHLQLGLAGDGEGAHFEPGQ